LGRAEADFSESVGAVTQILPAGQVVRDLAEGAERLLRATVSQRWRRPAPLASLNRYTIPAPYVTIQVTRMNGHNGEVADVGAKVVSTQPLRGS
jgi:hypothetical protein